jgi:hypothetical protein
MHTSTIDLTVQPPVARDAFNGTVWRETPLTGGLATYLSCRVCGGPHDADHVSRALRLHETQACSQECLITEIQARRAEYRARFGREPRY